MLCNNCGSREASFHKTTIVNGVKNEIHLCSECAGTSGVTLEIKSEIFNSLNVGEFFGSGNSQPSVDAVPVVKRCEVCGTKITELHKTALLGCANCYKVFNEDVARMTDMAHGTGAIHKGKEVSGAKQNS